MQCARCQAPSEYFGSSGDPLCRVCFYAAQQAVQNVRSKEESYGLEATGNAGGLRGRVGCSGIATVVIAVPIVAVSVVGGSGRMGAIGGIMLVAGVIAITRSVRGDV